MTLIESQIGFKPTPQQLDRLRTRSGMFKVSGDEVFATFQGEGSTIGQPAVFLRLHFCNLRCSWCDTKYTWDNTLPEFWDEPSDWSIVGTTNKINRTWDEKFQTLSQRRLVITGGEPMLQQKKIVELIEHLPDWEVEIETNGTVRPLECLVNKCQFNVSPKLENSGNAKVVRYKPEVLKTYAAIDMAWFKFVVTSPDDFVELDKIVAECKLPTRRIIVMPEGSTQEEVANHAKEILPGLEQRGWRILPRLQLILFGSKRRT